MAINTFVGYLYREFAMGGVERDAVTFFTVCVPIVVIGKTARREKWVMEASEGRNR